MPRPDLKNKPLIEAILEIKWKLEPTSIPGILQDRPYRLLLGRFYERVRGEYRCHEQLDAASIPDEMAAHVVQHRFRVKPNGWPLLQLGPGIMTINDTEGYTWPDFQRRCEDAVSKLVDAHPEPASMRMQEVTLRYIDAVVFDYSKESILNFLSDKMKTTLALPDSLFESRQIQRNPSSMNWQVSFQAMAPQGIVTLRFATGNKRKEPALVWETLLVSKDPHTPSIPEGFPQWLESAHVITDDWFFKLIEGELLRRFSGE